MHEQYGIVDQNQTRPDQLPAKPFQSAQLRAPGVRVGWNGCRLPLSSPFLSHLCPIRSMCFSSADSAMLGDAKCTNASPVVRPCPSCSKVIPLGTISNPKTQRPKKRSVNFQFVSLTQREKNRNTVTVCTHTQT